MKKMRLCSKKNGIAFPVTKVEDFTILMLVLFGTY